MYTTILSNTLQQEIICIYPHNSCTLYSQDTDKIKSEYLILDYTV